MALGDTMPPMPMVVTTPAVMMPPMPTSTIPGAMGMSGAATSTIVGIPTATTTLTSKTNVATASSSSPSGLSGLQFPENYSPQGQDSTAGLAIMSYAYGPRLIKLKGKVIPYWVSDHNIKIPMLSNKVFKSYNNKASDAQEVSRAEFDYYANATYIKQQGTSKIYKLDGTKKHLMSQTALDSVALTSDDNTIISVNKTEFASYATGAAIK